MWPHWEERQMNRSRDTPKFFFGELSLGFGTTGQGVVRPIIVWAPVCPAGQPEYLSERYEIFFQETSSSSGWHQASSGFSFSQHEIPEDICFRCLVAKGRCTTGPSRASFLLPGRIRMSTAMYTSRWASATGEVRRP